MWWYVMYECGATTTLDGDSFEGSFEAFLEDFEQGSTDQFEGKYNFKHHPIIL